MVEPRITNRARTILGAKIIFNNRSSTVDCVIRNISDTGAKISLDDQMSIPQRFEFSVPQKGMTYDAKAVWRQDNEVGIEFIKEPASQIANGSQDNLQQRVIELEAENKSLRKRLADFKAQIERHSQAGA